MVQVNSLDVSPSLVNASCAWASDLGQLQALFDSPYTGAVVTRTSTLAGFEEDDSHTVAFASSSTTSLNSYGYSPHKLSQYLSWIESILGAAPAAKRKPFIISITASYPDVLKSTIGAIQELRNKGPAFAGIGIEFNASCPNIRGAVPWGYAFANLVPLLTVLVDAWRADNSLTLGLKLPPYVYAAQFAEVLATLHDLNGQTLNPIAIVGASGTEERAFAVPTALGGIAGDSLHPLALGNVYSFARLLEAEDLESGLKNLVIFGIGGGAECAKAGASIVGSATLFGKEGVQAFKILSGE
ncbi:hypothetical protein B0H14DRAFT_2876684 [Mycena olivaceomarginata]|nr:hypothetical protein B0H14DRAFT_2876684 [Mycena olivaceomarginata]